MEKTCTWSSLGVDTHWNEFHAWYELKLRPTIFIDKRFWLMVSSLWSRDPYVFCKPNVIKNWKNDVIEEPLLSRRHTVYSCKLIPLLDPKIRHGPCFSQWSLLRKFWPSWRWTICGSSKLTWGGNKFH